MKYLFIAVVFFSFHTSAMAQQGPVDILSELDRLPNLTIVIAPNHPARMFTPGTVHDTVIRVDVNEYANDEPWRCIVEAGPVVGITHVGLVSGDSTLHLVGSPYLLLEPTNWSGRGLFDVRRIHGGGYTTSGRLAFDIPDRELCGPLFFNGRITSPDLNGDLAINIADVALFTQYYRSGDIRTDFNGDGVVNIADLREFASYFANGE